jgi:hypothetical protein
MVLLHMKVIIATDRARKGLPVVIIKQLLSSRAAQQRVEGWRISQHLVVPRIELRQQSVADLGVAMRLMQMCSHCPSFCCAGNVASIVKLSAVNSG